MDYLEPIGLLASLRTDPRNNSGFIPVHTLRIRNRSASVLEGTFTDTRLLDLHNFVTMICLGDFKEAKSKNTLVTREYYTKDKAATGSGFPKSRTGNSRYSLFPPFLWKEETENHISPFGEIFHHFNTLSSRSGEAT
jgi:hypothetical protein